MATIDGVRRVANGAAAKVTKAKDACYSALQKLPAPIEQIGQNWTGESGNAMKLALEELQAMIQSAYNDLLSADSLVQAQAKYIGDNWVDDKE